MFGFMFGVLGSVIFWAVYIVVSFFVSLLIMKKVKAFAGPFRILSTGSDKGENETKVSSMAALILLMTTWPILLLAYILVVIFKVFMCKALWWMASSAAKAVKDKVPDVKITFGDEEKKEAEADTGC